MSTPPLPILLFYSITTDIVRGLLEAGADVTAVERGGWTALAAACAGGHHRVVQHLLDAGGDPNHADEFGRTLLHDAADEGNSDVVK